jgi:hypothetical protein
VRKPVDEDFPLAEKIIPVMDNLNMHNIASLYETYPAEEVKRIKDWLELHYTPKHGSWLNMAEIEPSVINNQGLPARVGTLEEMRQYEHLAVYDCRCPDKTETSLPSV